MGDTSEISIIGLHYSPLGHCWFWLWGTGMRIRNLTYISSVHFSYSVVSDSLRPHGWQHTRPPCASPTPRVYSNSCPLSRWCHPIISSSVVPFSSCINFLVHRNKRKKRDSTNTSMRMRLIQFSFWVQISYFGYWPVWFRWLAHSDRKYDHFFKLCSLCRAFLDNWLP